MLLVEMIEVQKLSVIYEFNKGAILLEKNREVGIRKKIIDIFRHFMGVMVEDKDIDTQCILSEDNPAYIMTNSTLEADFARHMKRITEG